MNIVTFNYNKRKAGFALVFAGMIFILPFGFYFLNPNFFSTANKSVGELLQSVGLFGCMLLTGATLSLVLVRKFLSKAPALELSEAGIRSNVTEFSEKFLPLADISEAVVTLNHKRYEILHVQLKEEALSAHTQLFVNSRLFKVKPAMRIWYELLDGSAESIASTINQYIDDADKTNSTNATLAGHLGKAA